MTHSDPHVRVSHHYAGAYRQPERPPAAKTKGAAAKPASRPVTLPPLGPQAVGQRPAVKQSVAPTTSVGRSDGQRLGSPRPGQQLPLTQPAPPRVARSPLSAPRRQHRQHWAKRGFLASGSVLAAALVINSPALRNATPTEKVVCQEKIKPAAVLSRAELSELLTIPERSPKETVREILDEPYCLLSAVQVREGVMSDREAYPLEFDPQTWFVVLYEEGEYAGFDFKFRRE